MSAFALQSFNGVGNNWNKELNFFSKVSMVSVITGIGN